MFLNGMNYLTKSACIVEEICCRLECLDVVLRAHSIKKLIHYQLQQQTYTIVTVSFNRSLICIPFYATGVYKQQDNATFDNKAIVLVYTQ